MMTKSPPITIESSVVRVATASPPIRAPSPSAPTSPMMIRAGEVFHHRKPTQAAAAADGRADVHDDQRRGGGPPPQDDEGGGGGGGDHRDLQRITDLIAVRVVQRVVGVSAPVPVLPEADQRVRAQHQDRSAGGQ